ncbi:hypothetical protein LPJGGPFB_05649 [Ensifer adhaerens]|uniref:hypothetical protein n=1 Tax=Ensifer adhaerens TaxID=106592 RepID=UPI001568B73B|nr:hypothetical protein [Ensifer adhaerens]NRP22390.1 hypothetical protein [Ensifer adhaerens]
MSTDVTYSRKRYISVCVGCDLLFETVRKDQVTCSGACRVKAHRNGALKALNAHAKAFKVPRCGIGFSRAIGLLRPDLRKQVASGEVDMIDIMPDLCDAFDELARQVLEHVMQERNESGDANHQLRV